MTEERALYSKLPTLIEQLRALSRYENSDFSLGDDAADEIERLRGQERLLTIEIERLRSKLEIIAELLSKIQFDASTAARSILDTLED